MAIITHLKNGLLTEARFELVKPESFKCYYIDPDGTNVKNGSGYIKLAATYIFAYSPLLYDLVIKTNITFPAIQNKYGELKFKAMNNKYIRCIFINPNGDEIDISDNNYDNEDVQTFINNTEFTSNVGFDWSFDVSVEDPQYDKKGSFQTIDNGSAKEVFDKLNNVGYIIHHYKNKILPKHLKNKLNILFKKKYTKLINNYSFNLSNIEFIAIQDHQDDVRRARIYKKWFSAIANNFGNMTNFDIKDDIYFNITYNNSRIV